MYYVYQLVDPRTNTPFYVGKGKGNRAFTHLREVPTTRNQHKENKIAAIRKAGLEPTVEMIAENILDEDLAYDIERSLIARHGRKGYEKDGTLTNICLDNRPPNHAGKTYDEIYGDRAEMQRNQRAQKQKAAGGYGPRQHTEETRLRISESVARAHSERDCSHAPETRAKIGEANSKFVGKLNKRSHKYVLTSPAGETYTVYGSRELSMFCKENNLSMSTLKMQITNNWPVPRKGKTKGWKITSYVDGGGIKKDNLDALKGFEL